MVIFSVLLHMIFQLLAIRAQKRKQSSNNEHLNVSRLQLFKSYISLRFHIETSCISS